MVTDNTTDYGSYFDNGGEYDNYLEIRDRLNPSFKENQAEGAKQIKRVINQINNFSSCAEVKTIISLGCGTGEIELALAEIENSPKVIAFDSSENSVDILKKSKVSHPNVLTVSGEFNADLLSQIKRKHDYNSESTLLISLGHTIPHFLDWDEIISNINGDLLPKYLIIDFYETFDSTLDALKDRSITVSNPYFEVRGECPYKAKVCGTTCWHGLGTFSDENSIIRGIAFCVQSEFYQHAVKNENCPYKKILKDKKRPEKREKPKYIFRNATKQLNRKSNEYLKDLKNLGYIELDKFHYKVGYGHMQAYFMVKLDDTSSKIHDVYYSQIKNELINNKFLSGSNNLDDRLIKALSFFDTILMGVIKPFDSYLTFTENLPILDGMPYFCSDEKDVNNFKICCSIKCNDTEGSQLCNSKKYCTPKDLLVMPFNKSQNQYASADGIYFAILADPGCSLIVPPVLNREKKSHMCDVDFEYWDAEKVVIRHNQLLLNNIDDIESYTSGGIVECVKKGDLPNKTIKDNTFFCVPIYYGTLPLLYFLFKPKNTDILTARRELIEEIARNLEKAIKFHISEDLLASIFSGLLKSLHTPVDTNGEELKKKIKVLLNNAQSKPWKNGSHFFPEINIGETADAKKEDEKLDKIVKEQVEELLRGARWIISKWFQKQHFFEGDGHDSLHDSHIPILKNVKISEKSGNLVFLYSEQGESQTIYEVSNDDKLNYPIVKWFKESILGVKNVNTVNSLDEEDKQSWDCTFQKLKAFFCRDEANRGDLFRYSIYEIYALCDIYLVNHNTNDTNIIIFNQTELGVPILDPIQKIVIRNESVSDSILQISSQFHKTKAKRIQFSVTSNAATTDYKCKYNFSLVITFDRKITIQSGSKGNDKIFLSDCLDNIKKKYNVIIGQYGDFDTMILSWEIEAVLDDANLRPESGICNSFTFALDVRNSKNGRN